MLGGLGGYDKDFSARFSDGGEELTERFEIGYAEWAPVAAVDWGEG